MKKKVRKAIPGKHEEKMRKISAVRLYIGVLYIREKY